MNNLFSLEGRVALVTGGSRGIGYMLTRGLLEFGCSRVYISSRKARLAQNCITGRKEGACRLSLQPGVSADAPSARAHRRWP